MSEFYSERILTDKYCTEWRKTLNRIIVVKNRKNKLMNIDYKALDTQKIRDYIDALEVVVTVDDIIRNSGADKLRVYPALFELEQDGYIEVTEREELGARVAVRRKKI